MTSVCRIEKPRQKRQTIWGVGWRSQCLAPARGRQGILVTTRNWVSGGLSLEHLDHGGTYVCGLKQPWHGSHRKHAHAHKTLLPGNPNYLLVCLPSAGVRSVHCRVPWFWWVWGIEFRPSNLQGKQFPLWVISSAPTLLQQQKLPTEQSHDVQTLR